MRYRIEPPGWPVAGVLLPAGTIIDTSDPDCLAKDQTNHGELKCQKVVAEAAITAVSTSKNP